MPKRGKINRRNDFDGSIAKAMQKVQDKVDAYPESVKSTIQDKTLVGGSKRKMPATEYPSSAASTLVPYISIPAKRSRQLPASNQNLPSSSKSPDENCYTIPEIGPDKQLTVDTNMDEFNRISAGARVMAPWGTKYYAAFICGSDTLGRYYVVFDEDKYKRAIPPDGIIPISMLTTSTKVMFITSIDGKVMDKLAEISKQPSKDDPKLWAEGIFELKFSKDDGSEEYQTESVSWSKICLTKDQAAAIKTKKTNGFLTWEGSIVDPRTRRSRPSFASQSSANVPATPKATPKRSRSAKKQNATQNDDANVTNEMQEEEAIFTGLNFVLTTAPRSNKGHYFKKGEFRNLIKQRGGTFINDLKTLHDSENTFLISDTYYRTEKYFLALSLSIPCVRYQWIIKCVNANKVLPCENFMLPSGETPLDFGFTYEWKPLKGTLLHGKKIMIYSNSIAPTPLPNGKLVSFGGIWTPIVANLGAELIKPFESGVPIQQKLKFIKSNEIDILLTDITCEEEVAEAVELRGGDAVSSDWLMDAMITGEIVDPEAGPHYMYDLIRE